MNWQFSRSFRRPLAPLILGVFIALFGALLAVGGAWLAILGGSKWYVLAGIALLVSGVLLCQRRMLGGWIFIGTFALSLGWAFAETGPDGWALVPRVIPMLVLFVAVCLVMPTLSSSASRMRCRSAMAQ